MNIDFIDSIHYIGRCNLALLRCDKQSVNETIKGLQDYGVAVINVGRELSERLKDIKSKKFLSMEAQNYLQKIVEEKASVTTAQSKQKVVALYNIGILFEPALCLNLPNLLKELSKDIIVIILWDKFYSDGLLHWGVQEGQYHLDLSDIYISEERAKYEV